MLEMVCVGKGFVKICGFFNMKFFFGSRVLENELLRNCWNGIDIRVGVM